MVAFMMIQKVRFAQRNQALGIDGALYYDVAENVSRGLGLVTDAALFNAGFSYFPHETVLYPLWPLLLGTVAKLLPLWTAAKVVPPLLYGLSLLLAYRLVRGLYPQPLVPELWPVLNAGHAVVLLAGFNPAYFISTSRPFTEGLAYAMLALFFLRVKGMLERPSSLRALEVGLWAGLLVLVRSQLVLAGGVLLGFLSLRALLVRGAFRLPILAALGMGAVLGEQWLYFHTFIDAPSPQLLLRFDLHRDPSPLPVIQVMVSTDGLWDWIRDRAKGIPVAYGAGRQSFIHALGPIALSFLLVWPVLVLPALLRSALLRSALLRRLLEGGKRALQRRSRMGLWGSTSGLTTGEEMSEGTTQRTPETTLGVRSRLQTCLEQLKLAVQSPEHASKLYLLLFALAGWASLHTIHKASFASWNFGTRHGLTAFFLAFACWLWLIQKPGMGRVLGLTLLIGSSAVTADRIERVIEKLPRPVAASWRYETASPLARWLEQEQARLGPLRVVIEDGDAQVMASRTQGLGYYWVFRKTTLDELKIFFAERGAVYLILPSERYAAHGFMSPRQAFRETFMLVQQLDGYDVYRWRERVEQGQQELKPGACAPVSATTRTERGDEP